MLFNGGWYLGDFLGWVDYSGSTCQVGYWAFGRVEIVNVLVSY